MGFAVEAKNFVDGKFGKHVESLPEGADVLDYSGYSIAPGPVDTQAHSRISR